MEGVYIILSFLVGAAIPSYLLWRKDQECQHLLNCLLKREKVPTTDRPFEGIPEKVPPPEGSAYKDRRSRPTAIDVLMKAAEEADNEAHPVTAH